MLPPAIRRKLEKNRSGENQGGGEQSSAHQPHFEQSGDRPASPGQNVYDPLFVPEMLLLQDSTQEDGVGSVNNSTPHVQAEPSDDDYLSHYEDYLDYRPAAPRPTTNAENEEDEEEEGANFVGVPSTSRSFTSHGPSSKRPRRQYNVDSKLNQETPESDPLRSMTSSCMYQGPQQQQQQPNIPWPNVSVSQLPQTNEPYSLITGQEQTCSNYSRMAFPQQSTTVPSVAPQVSINNINIHQNSPMPPEWQMQGRSANAYRPSMANAQNMIPGAPTIPAYDLPRTNQQTYSLVPKQELANHEEAHPSYPSQTCSDVSSYHVRPNAESGRVGMNNPALDAARLAAAMSRNVSEPASANFTPRDGYSLHARSGPIEGSYQPGAAGSPTDINSPPTSSSHAQFGRTSNAGHFANHRPSEAGFNHPNRHHPYTRMSHPNRSSGGISHAGLQPETASSAFTPTPSLLEQLPDQRRFFRYTLDLSSVIGDFVAFLSEVAEVFNSEFQHLPEGEYSFDFVRQWPED